MKENFGDPRCPICRVIPNLEELTSETWSGTRELTACCRHLVPTLVLGCVAEELAGFCGGQLVWKRIRGSLSLDLKEKWREAEEDEGQSHDLEGEYFIKRFVEPCAAVAEVDLHYATVGSVGCASNACTPFVWVTDRKAFAHQLLQQLKHLSAATAAQAAKCRRKAGAKKRPTRKPSKPDWDKVRDASIHKGTGTPTKESLDLAGINKRHVRGVDKWYRMYAGAASNLTSFENGIIYLDIHVDNRLDQPLAEITRKIAESWLMEVELRCADGYLAHIYKTERPSGGVAVPNPGGLEALAGQLLHLVNGLAKQFPDVLITTISGSYANP